MKMSEEGLSLLHRAVTYLERKIIIAQEVCVLEEGYDRLDNEGTVMYAGMIREERVGEENLCL